MEDKELCEKFIAADKIINGGYYDTMTMEDKTKYPEFNKYCSNSKCETNMQLNGLSEDLFNQLGTEIKDEYYEYFMMWLSDKLFKIAKEDDKSQNNDITLNEAYDKYLKNNIQNGNYWSLLDIKEGLKEANLKYMKQFYKLLNNICEAIVYYKRNDDDIEKFIINSTECYNQYSSLYNSVLKCNSYLHLLDNLKKTYEDFKNSVHEEIKNNYQHLAGRLQTLTIENTDSYFVGKFKAFDFSDENCKLETKKTGELSHQNRSEDSKSKPKDSGSNKGDGDKVLGGGISQPGSSDSQTKDSRNPVPASSGTSTTTSKDPQNGVSNPQNPNSKQEVPGGTGDGGSGGNGLGGGGSDGSGSGIRDGSEGPGGGKDSGANGGSKTLGDQVPTHPSGEPNGYLLSNWGMNFNLTSYMPNFSGMYQSSNDILTSATNQVSNAYNSAMTIAQNTYDKTVNIAKNTYDTVVSTVKDTYTRSTNYISDAVNSITNQFNPFGTSQLGDNQSGSNSLGGGTDTSNHSQKNTKQPVNPPPPPLPSSPSPSSPQTPPDPQALSDPPSQKPLDPQTSSTQIHNCPVQQIAPTDGNRASQTPVSGQGALSISGSNSLNTKKENVISVANVKVKETSSIWCIGSNNKCDIMGISIIVISISIILTIIYKYLSLGYTRKSKRKKSMKKVINSIGGKRPIQIIIKSYDRNKDLKPVINSVGRKKDPLLNIYKLMQADPVPFINVFFLLTFFVYKRQLNYLEL
ncbi:PIR protein CIR protein [Plasmodium vinckei lentum]|uniref:PIR protein CIR protein n=1 Tax=Plasmodium vinckei lentum TaxID=138297 RepID=A0A6V7T3H9_PLAVN|nr:PIR protein CIR protein [Plasmodium vinckei lentum]